MINHYYHHHLALTPQLEIFEFVCLSSSFLFISRIGNLKKWTCLEKIYYAQFVLGLWGTMSFLDPS